MDLRGYRTYEREHAMGNTMIGGSASGTTPVVTFEDGSALRFELQSLRAAGAASDALVNTFAAAADAVDEMARADRAAAASGRFTAEGLADEHRRNAKPVLDFATRVDAVAERIDAERGRSFDAEWSRLMAPSRDAVDAMAVQQLQDVLKQVDPVYRHQLLVSAASSGERANDGLLRAALLFPRPPFETPGWPVLVPEQTMTAIREAIADRVSPQGSAAWEADAYRTLANRLRRAAGFDPLLTA
jgi:hypothetical protein